ncbi:hypothetical protein ACFQ1T_13820 [Methylophilus glucosoxydans]|uniref:RiboL-PSP-HEPN domain-containing protein n=1 Tax=Methylophilus glucosoxydans TaxID=752553 RepID=A0ABW3GLG7_9PROT
MVEEITDIWRWNVDDVWQSYSSMFQEASLTHTSCNEIERYHHLSASLLFGGCAIESFLNAKMRAHCKSKGVDEDQVLKRLRFTNLRDKLERWPSEFCETAITPADINCIADFLDLRNEVTHRKRKDHSLYKELDETNILIFVQALQRAIVTIYSGLGESFPYWLLGWNYVGMNGDETHPCLLSNQQFKHSLNRFGFKVPAWEYHAANEWERAYMSNSEGFTILKEQVYSHCPDIEPRSDRFPGIPRLCKRWWDRSYIKNA